MTDKTVNLTKTKFVKEDGEIISKEVEQKVLTLDESSKKRLDSIETLADRVLVTCRENKESVTFLQSRNICISMIQYIDQMVDQPTEETIFHELVGLDNLIRREKMPIRFFLIVLQMHLSVYEISINENSSENGPILKHSEISQLIDWSISTLIDLPDSLLDCCYSVLSPCIQKVPFFAEKEFVTTKDFMTKELSRDLQEYKKRSAIV